MMEGRPGPYEYTRALLVRVSVLAVCCYHVDSPAVEVHRIGAVTAVDGVLARVVVSLDYVISGTGAHPVDASVVSAYEVRAATTTHEVVAEVAPNLVGALVAGDRVVAPVTADAVVAASSRESVVSAAASYLVGPGGAYDGVGTGSAVEGPCQCHPACEEHCYSYRSKQQSYSSHVPPSFAEHHSPHPIVATSVHPQVWPQLDGVPGKIAQRVRKDRQTPSGSRFQPCLRS